MPDVLGADVPRRAVLHTQGSHATATWTGASGAAEASWRRGEARLFRHSCRRASAAGDRAYVDAHARGVACTWSAGKPHLAALCSTMDGLLHHTV